MRKSLTKNQHDSCWIASVTDEYALTTVFDYIYPSDLSFFQGDENEVLDHIFNGLQRKLEKFLESCERRGYTRLLGSYSTHVIDEATQRDDWEMIVGIMERPKTLEEVHEGCEL